jgi:CRP/FNR family cyclic AMP-dependent transcriptional regulator
MTDWIRRIDQLLAEVEVLSDLDPAHRELIAGCGVNQVVADGAYLFREGEPAETFYAIRHGTVALELSPPARKPVVIETLHEADVVGWSWLFEPYRYQFDARAIGTLRVIAFDGACLRGKCEEDHDLGFELMRRFAGLIANRLQATRVQLLDVYEPRDAGS